MRLILTALLTLFATPALACGPDTDCTVLNGERSYRYYLPEGADGPVGAVFYSHGFRGSAGGAMGNRALLDMADRLNMAFVALNADGEDWNLARNPHNPSLEASTEYRYVAAVIEDLATRIALDRDRLIATGFSAGGMLTWTLACGMSDSFAGFVPYSGTFWAPIPDSCPTPPATVIHIHGDADRTVPQDGRAIGQSRQGNIRDVFDMYGTAGGYGPPVEEQAAGGMTCQSRENPEGAVLAFCEFAGGHSFSVARVEWAIERILGGS